MFAANNFRHHIGIRSASLLLALCCLSGCATFSGTTSDDDRGCAHCTSSPSPLITAIPLEDASSSLPPARPVLPPRVRATETPASSDDYFAPQGRFSINAQESCETKLEAARAELDERISALERQVRNERLQKEVFERNLLAVNTEMTRLSQEIDHWRNEVRRIDRSAEMQHQSDLASLERISRLIEQLASERTNVSAAGPLLPPVMK
ncbi:MAG: hypothetical protein RIK87_05875 [Fuerstiella sp.]